MPTKAAKPVSAAAKPLTAREQSFVDNYLVSNNPRQAALAAGYSASMAASKAYGWTVCDGLYSKPHLLAAIERGKAAIHERLAVQATDVLRHWIELATADPNELTQLRRVNCRECHGIGGAYQWLNRAEFSEALKLAMLEAGDDPILNASLPTDEGGFGYDVTRDPAEHCLTCRGEGIPVMHLCDTRKLSGPARRLFAGATRTKDGVNIKMHDQAKAWENIARHLGMFNDKLTLAGDKENPIAVLVSQLQGSAIKPQADPLPAHPTPAGEGCA